MAGKLDRLAPKLAVILHADIVGSTALVQIDEGLAHERIQNAFQRLSQLVHYYGGIAHEIRGDALLAEFSRASDALCAALSFQSNNAEFNALIDDQICPSVRIGISMGEIIIADGTLTGPEVVLAQRIEQLADAGSVCILDNVRQSIPARLPFRYYDLGEQVLKGFDNTMKAHIVTLVEGAALPGPQAKSVTPRMQYDKKQATIFGIVVLATVLTGWWWFHARLDFEPVQPASLSYPLPEKPSIAILPFTNLGTDPADAAIGNGIMTSIISVLSSSPDLFVVSQNSTLRLEGKSTAPSDVARAFGVRYVLEGTIQRDGERLRVTSQLADTSTGRNVWSEKFDSTLQDIFDVQDEVTGNVVKNLQIKLTIGSQVRQWIELAGGFENYLEIQRGRAEFQKFSLEGHIEAKRIWEALLEKHPDLVYEMFVGWIYWQRVVLGLSEDPQGDLEEAMRLGKIAVERHPDCADCYVMLGTVAIRLGIYDTAIDFADRALSLTPGAADVNSLAGNIMMTSGVPEAGITLLRRGMRYEPDYPHWIPATLTHALIMTSRYDEAQAIAEGVQLSTSENVTAHPISLTQLAVIYQMTANDALAAEYIVKLRQLFPDRGIDQVRHEIKHFKDKNYVELFLEALHKAGLPEH